MCQTWKAVTTDLSKASWEEEVKIEQDLTVNLPQIERGEKKVQRKNSPITYRSPKLEKSQQVLANKMSPL